ncbi:MAG: hypothetical protein K5860_11065 [Bacteroidales bacterium]|nr:hypothetical protein [Bacteroidales bacterium]
MDIKDVLLNSKNEGALAGSFTSYAQKHIEKYTGNTRKIFYTKMELHS